MEKTGEQWVNEGDELDDAGQRDEAMKCFDLAIELDPNYARAWFLTLSHGKNFFDFH